MLTIGYLWEEYEKFWFFIMCHDWLNVSGHSLLIAQIQELQDFGQYQYLLNQVAKFAKQ